MKMILLFKKLGAFLTVFLLLAALVISFFAGMSYQWMSTAEIETEKSYSKIVVEENDIADYRVFTDIPEKFSNLEQIEEPIRKTISLYMQANNLKLAEGTQRFKRINGSLDEYINKEFKFESIE